MIVFYGEKRTFRPKGFIRVGKSQTDPAEAALNELRSFLDPNEPEIAKILYNTWQSQGNAISYKTLREALIYTVEHNGLDGMLLWYNLYREWQDDYNKFVKNTLAPMWNKAIDAAAERTEKEINERIYRENGTNDAERVKPWHWDGARAGVKDWCETKAAAFVTNSTETQIEAVREVIKRAAVLNTYNVETLSHVIRPMVGLTKRDSTACINYLKTLGEKGVKPAVVADRVHRYAQRKHKVRSEVISRTELAFAYNHGQFAGAVQAYEDGYLGRFEKVWSTAADERVCRICGDLNNTAIGIYDDFEGIQTKLTDPDAKKCPPAHPRCRCGFYIREIEKATAETEAQAARREFFNNGVDISGDGGIINYARASDLFLYEEDDIPASAPIKPEHIVSELEKAPIGREVIEYLENNNVAVYLNYERQWHFDRGNQKGNEIQIFMSNISSVRVVAQTVIHELTHARYNIGDCQWAEAVCMAQEKKFLTNRDLTFAEKRKIVQLAHDNYPKYNWKKGGYKNGKRL